ncbi:MAG: SDR family oxidoreductase [Planctomycetes bacterium]|nr:SDR family oxidoreductase [Planctomycetota bacterium]
MTTPTHELAGQTAVVTGASSGIGRATALELASAGADLIIHARRSQSALDTLAAELRGRGVQVKALLADLGDPAEQDRLVAEAWAWRGRVDVWVNNAGVDVLTGEAARWSFEQKIASLWQVDVVATLRLSRDIGGRMSSQGHGVIINTGWDQAEQGMTGDSGQIFAAVKGAVMAATRSLAQALAPQVRVNCVAPGWIQTEWGHGASSDWQNRARKECLLERWGQPDDVARATRFLASPAAAFITGQTLNVNGGFRFGSPQQ